VQIVRILTLRESCVCGDIVKELPLAQSTVSQHLKVLKEAGLIRGEIDGPRTCYCLEPRTLRRLKALVGGLYDVIVELRIRRSLLHGDPR
jgi:ArsR family transcriptional regulator